MKFSRLPISALVAGLFVPTVSYSQTLTVNADRTTSIELTAATPNLVVEAGIKIETTDGTPAVGNDNSPDSVSIINNGLILGALGGISLNVNSTINNNIGGEIRVNDNTIGVNIVSGTPQIFNDGVLRAIGLKSIGVNFAPLSSNGLIFNTGLISASGADSKGIYLEGNTLNFNPLPAHQNARIINSGTISAEGNSSYAIKIGSGSDGSIIINNGLIEQKSVSQAIQTRANDITIINNDEIKSAGEAIIIWSGQGVNIVNNAKIKSDSDRSAIRFDRSSSGNITNYGLISKISGNLRPAVEVSDDSSVINYGEIYSAGRGIEARNRSQVINAGTIETLQQDNGAMHGILIRDNSSVINIGMVITRSRQSYGIELRSRSEVINTGFIHTFGALSHGISIDHSQSLAINSGVIKTIGDDAYGIRSHGDNNTVSNGGLISVSGKESYGVLLRDNNNTLNNSGTIQATGPNSFSIYSIDDRIQTVNIFPGSRILGRIDLRGGDDIANISGSYGSSALTFMSADTLTINLLTDNAVNLGVDTGSNTTTVLVIDPTGESVIGNTLSAMTAGAHQVINQRIQSAGVVQTVQLASADYNAVLALNQNEPMVWGQWFGQSGKRGDQGIVQGYDHDHQGVVFGFERNRAQHRQGLLVGYAKADTKSPTHKRKSDSIFVGAYGHQELGRFSLSGSIIVGQEQHKGQRWVLDNVNGEETARSSSRSHFVSPSITLGTSHALQSDIELRPSATVAYTYSRHNGYSESGTTLSNLQVASRNHQAWATRVQLEAAKPTRAGEVYARVGVQSRHTKSGNIQASAAGNAFQFAPQSSTNVSGSYVGLGVNWHLNQQYKLLLDAETGRMSGNESYSRGQMTLQYWF